MFSKEYLLKIKMKKLNLLSLILLTLTISSCGFLEDDSVSGVSSDGSPESIVETKITEINAETVSSTDDLFKDTNSKEPASEPMMEVAKLDAPSNITITPEQPIVVEEPKPVITEEKIVVEQEVQASKPQTYRVQNGETLMQIAFKLYGDVSRWKDLRHMNGDKLASNNALKPHMELKYIPSADNFVWKREGTPYLIKTGETLGTISTSVYQTPKYWKKIWENNKPLIKNPNLIYAGFTLYYKSPAEMALIKRKQKENKVEINEIDEEISNIQSATERETIDISPLAE